jgi:hypothetical protein
VLDFKHKAGEVMVIQVREDADLDKVNVQLVNGGSAAGYLPKCMVMVLHHCQVRKLFE